MKEGLSLDKPNLSDIVMEIIDRQDGWAISRAMLNPHPAQRYMNTRRTSRRKRATVYFIRTGEGGTEALIKVDYKTKGERHE